MKKHTASLPASASHDTTPDPDGPNHRMLKTDAPQNWKPVDSAVLKATGNSLNFHNPTQTVNESDKVQQ